MKIDKETVDKIANLAKLEFDEPSKDAMVQDLSRIITFVEKLGELDTANIEPLIFMSDEVNVLREDVIIPGITQEEALKNAPNHDTYYIKAPKVLGE